MDTNKKTLRLKSDQKKLLELIISSKILDDLKIDKCLIFNEITPLEIKDLKQYKNLRFQQSNTTIIEQYQQNG
jgi:hypothetical protein